MPATVLLELLGLGDRGLELTSLKRWSRDSLELFWGWPDPERQEVLATSAAEFYSWLRAQDARARRTGGQDLFGQLAAGGLSPREAVPLSYFLLVAGHETTSQLIATAFLRLIGEPHHWESIGADGNSVAAAVDDLLRRESSVPTWRRESQTASTIGDVRLPAGASILLRLTGTGGTADLAFGLGSHRCLGASLATMETRVVVATASAAFPGLDLVEREPPMLKLLSFHAPRRVIVGRGLPRPTSCTRGLEQGIGQGDGRDQPPTHQPPESDGQPVPAGDLARYDESDPAAGPDVVSPTGEHLVEIVQNGV